MIDKRLTFGALSPEIFNKITQAIREIINSKCFKTVCYLDDSKDLQRMPKRELGFAVNRNKIDGSVQKSFTRT